jgi:hypothetical protein
MKSLITYKMLILTVHKHDASWSVCTVCIFAVFSVCSVSYVECRGQLTSRYSGQRALCSVQHRSVHGVCSSCLHGAVCSVCSVQCAVCAVFTVQCSVCSVQYAVCIVHCALCCVQCADGVRRAVFIS